MISKFKDFIKISFIQDVGILQIGKFISILLSVVASIILARWLGPELYGVYGLIFAFVGLVGIFIDWGAGYASLTLLAESYVKKDKQEIKDILTYFVKITFLAICTIGILSIILAPFLTDQLYQNSQIGSLARIILIATFLGVVYNLLVIVLQAIRQIKQLTILEIFNKLIYTLFPVVFLLIGWSLTGVVWGYFISSLIFLIFAIFVYSFLVKKDEFLPSLKQIFFNLKKVKIKKYFNFGFLIAIDKNLGRLVSILPIIFLGIFALPQEVGYFKIAFAYISIPIMILSPVSRLLSVQLPKSKTFGLKTLKKHFYKTTFYSGLISILLIIPFIFLAPYLIKFFYGQEYIGSIQLVYYLAILAAFSGFGVGVAPFYRTVNKMKTSIIVNIFQVILITILTIVLVKNISSLMAIIWALIITTTIFLLLHFLIIKYIMEKYEKN